MLKIIAWLILVFLVLLALRVINLRNARARQNDADGARTAATQARAEPMVRCARCGVYLPRSDARELGDSYACAAGRCAEHA